MKMLTVNVMHQSATTLDHELPCVECGKKDSAMAHIRMNVKQPSTHSPLGGVYCVSCFATHIRECVEILDPLVRNLK